MTEPETREHVPTLLLVEDDDALRGLLARALRERGFEVTAVADGDAAVVHARGETPEYAVVDLRVPGMPGIEILKALRQLDETTRVVMLSGYGSIVSAVEATKLGAVGYLPKPADPDTIVAALTGNMPARHDDGGETPSLARAEWEHIQRVLADSGGSISEAARKLGLHRRSLQRKLQRPPPAR